MEWTYKAGIWMAVGFTRTYTVERCTNEFYAWAATRDRYFVDMGDHSSLIRAKNRCERDNQISNPARTAA